MSADTTATTTTAEGQQPEDQQPEDQGSAREAQRLRARARDAEAERDALAQRVATFQQGEVLRLAGEHLAEPGDLLTLGGVQVADLLAEDGSVDPALVEGAAAALVEARGARFAKAVPTANYDGGVRTTARTPTASWSSVLGGREAAR